MEFRSTTGYLCKPGRLLRHENDAFTSLSPIAVREPITGMHWVRYSAASIQIR